MKVFTVSAVKFKPVLFFLITLFIYITVVQGQIRNNIHRVKPAADSSIITPGMRRILTQRVPPPNVQQPVTVKLSADRNPVQVGEQVKLIAVLSRNISGAVFNFYNENGTLIQSNQGNECDYRFPVSGAHLVLVKVNNPTVYVARLPDIGIVIDTLRIQADSVALIVYPVIIEQGRDVTFKTQFYPEPGIVFRFVFADNSYSEWNTNPSTTHLYSRPGLYNAYAEIGISEKGEIRILTRSVSKQVNVIPPPPLLPDTNAIPFVKLSADRPEAKTGEVVSFAAFSNYKRDGLQYMFKFGDGNSRQSTSSSAEHIYTEYGAFTVVVRILYDNEYLDASDSVEIIINPSLRTFVTLRADTSSGSAGDTIRFTAFTRSRMPGLKYIFFTGVPGQSFVSQQNAINYSYNNSGTYNAYVQLVLNDNILATSEVLNIFITEQPASLWWLYLTAILVISAAGFGIKKIFPVPKPSFRAYPGSVKTKIENEKEFNTKFEVHFNPNIYSAKYNFSNNPVKEIKYE